jgi:hypothetical protein
MTPLQLLRRHETEISYRRSSQHPSSSPQYYYELAWRRLLAAILRIRRPPVPPFTYSQGVAHLHYSTATRF